MEKNKIGILLLCLFVFILLVFTFYVLLSTLISSLILNIKSGADDEQIKKEYELFVSKHGASKKKTVNFFYSLISVILISAIVGLIGYTILTRDSAVGNIPVLKTIESGSMSFQHEDNEYLKENNLNNQISVNDLVFLEKMPQETDLKQYDIVLYKSDGGKLILHRIIEIKEVDGHKAYIFQGDANPVKDGEEVEYNQMLGIYRGKHIPLLGNFIKFIRSPAGLLCLALILIVSMGYPFIEKKLLEHKKDRLIELGYSIEELIANKYTKK